MNTNKMESLELIDLIKTRHILDNDDLIDILEKLSYIARDNHMDDTLTETLITVLSE